MRKEKLVVDRVRTLVDSATELATKRRGFSLNYDELNFAAGWLASAANCIELLTRPASAYRMSLVSARATFETAGMIKQNESSDKSAVIGSVRGILQNLLEDIEAGLIIDLESRVVGEAFGDFLDHAEKLASKGQKASGVLAGVVFEDTIRRIGQNNNITHERVDEVISMLVKATVITEAKAKLARVGAHVRTKATHADWEAFDIPEVKATIAVTRDLIDSHLS